MPRRSLIYPVVCGLAIVSALVLLRAASLVEGADVDYSADSTRVAVRAFYDAANVVLASGDVTALDAVVAPEFAVDAPAPGLSPDRAGLAAYLAAVHATAPGAQLVVEEITATGDRAMARVAIEGGDPAAFLGTPLRDLPPTWGTRDAFRVADGRVVELVGGADRSLLLQPLRWLSLGLGLATRQNVALERWTVEPGAPGDAQTGAEWHAIFVTEGTLTVAHDATSPAALRWAPATGREAATRPQPIGSGATTKLTVGEAVAFPRGSRYAVRNDGQTEAAALALIARTPELGSPMSSGDPAYGGQSSVGDGGLTVRGGVAGHTAPGFSVQPLAGDLTTALPERATAGALGRATLAPGAALALAKGAGPTLVYVEAGTLGLEATDGSAWVRRGSNGTSSDVTGGLLAAGDGALVPAGTALDLRNPYDEPTVVFVVTIAPDAATA